MSTVIAWNEDDHPRAVHGRFTKALQKAQVGSTIRTQDNSASIRVMSSSSKGLKGPNRKVYHVARKGDSEPTTKEGAAAVASHALDASARNTGRDSLGPGEKAYDGLDDAIKAHEGGSSAPASKRFKRKQRVGAR